MDILFSLPWKRLSIIFIFSPCNHNLVFRFLVAEKEVSAEFSFYWTIIIFLVLIIMGIFGSYGWAKYITMPISLNLLKMFFKKEYGVIWKKYISIPYGRIQNIDIHRGILLRILGLSDLMIQTAGYGGGYAGGGLLLGGLRTTEGRLPALSKERTEEVREELIRKIKEIKEIKSGL